MLFIMDAREGVTRLDQIFARWLRKQGRPVILLANKCEGREGGGGIAEAYGLGLGDPVAISAEHGEGWPNSMMGSRPICAKCAAEARNPPPSVETKRRRARQADPLAIIGRPNAGKSTLINRLIGEDRMLTGPEAGITRDSISVDWEYEGQSIRLIDTAGMRRTRQCQEKLEKLSVADTIRAISFAQVVVLVMDKDTLDTQDLQLAELVEREGRALVIAANKWDSVEDKVDALKMLQRRVEYYCPR